MYFVAFLFDVMAEGVPSATGSEPVKEKLLIWCGKQNKTQKKLDEEATNFFLSINNSNFNQ